MTDCETPPIKDLAQRKTASGESGGGFSHGAEGDKLNNHILDDSPTERKSQGKWKDFTDSVPKDEVIKGLAKPGVKVFLSSDGCWWRKKPDCDQTYQYFERLTKPASEQAESGVPDQSQGQPETGSESVVQSDKATEATKADKDWRGGDYYSYTCQGCAHRAFDRAIKYETSDRSYWDTKGIFLTIASAARQNSDGEWITKIPLTALTGGDNNAARKIRKCTKRLENAGLLIPLKTSKRDGRAWKMGFTVHRG